MRRRLLVVLGGLLVPLVVPASAAADAPVDRGIDVFTERETLDCGNFSVERVSDFRIRFATRPAPDDPFDRAFLASDTVNIDTTVTNTTTGKTFTARYHGHFAEVRAAHVSGDVYRFEVHENENLLIRAPGGRPYLRENVNVRQVVLFDTLGDDRPGGEVLSMETTVVSGEPFDPPDPCEVAGVLTF